MLVQASVKKSIWSFFIISRLEVKRRFAARNPIYMSCWYEESKSHTCVIIIVDQYRPTTIIKNIRFRWSSIWRNLTTDLVVQSIDWVNHKSFFSIHDLLDREWPKLYYIGIIIFSIFTLISMNFETL